MTLKIFTDGSYLLHTKKKQSGYAFIILDGEREYVKYGKLKVECISSTYAEVYSLLNSIHYSLGKFDNIEQIIIRCDCTTAMEMISGAQNHYKAAKYKKIRTDVQETIKLLKNRKIKTITQHIKGHSVKKGTKDGAYNQCVDSLAKLGANL